VVDDADLARSFWNLDGDDCECYSTLVMSPTKKLMFRLAAAVAAFELLAWAALAISRVN
jgi:hypothetical protein